MEESDSQTDKKGIYNMEWLSKNVEVLKIIGSVVVVSILSTVWMNVQFNELRSEIREVEKDVAVIRTVMIMRNIMPSEICKKEDK